MFSILRFSNEGISCHTFFAATMPASSPPWLVRGSDHAVALIARCGNKRSMATISPGLTRFDSTSLNEYV